MFARCTDSRLFYGSRWLRVTLCRSFTIWIYVVALLRLPLLPVAGYVATLRLILTFVYFRFTRLPFHALLPLRVSHTFDVYLFVYVCCVTVVTVVGYICRSRLVHTFWLLLHVTFPTRCCTFPYVPVCSTCYTFRLLHLVTLRLRVLRYARLLVTRLVPLVATRCCVICCTFGCYTRYVTVGYVGCCYPVWFAILRLRSLRLPRYTTFTLLHFAGGLPVTGCRIFGCGYAVTFVAVVTRYICVTCILRLFGYVYVLFVVPHVLLRSAVVALRFVPVYVTRCSPLPVYVAFTTVATVAVCTFPTFAFTFTLRYRLIIRCTFAGCVTYTFDFTFYLRTFTLRLRSHVYICSVTFVGLRSPLRCCWLCYTTFARSGYHVVTFYGYRCCSFVYRALLRALRLLLVVCCYMIATIYVVTVPRLPFTVAVLTLHIYTRLFTRLHVTFTLLFTHVYGTVTLLPLHRLRCYVVPFTVVSLVVTVPLYGLLRLRSCVYSHLYVVHVCYLLPAGFYVPLTFTFTLFCYALRCSDCRFAFTLRCCRLIPR